MASADLLWYSLQPESKVEIQQGETTTLEGRIALSGCRHLYRKDETAKLNKVFDFFAMEFDPLPDSLKSELQPGSNEIHLFGGLGVSIDGGPGFMSILPDGRVASFGKWLKQQLESEYGSGADVFRRMLDIDHQQTSKVLFTDGLNNCPDRIVLHLLIQDVRTSYRPNVSYSGKEQITSAQPQNSKTDTIGKVTIIANAIPGSEEPEPSRGGGVLKANPRNEVTAPKPRPGNEVTTPKPRPGNVPQTGGWTVPVAAPPPAPPQSIPLNGGTIEKAIFEGTASPLLPLDRPLAEALVDKIKAAIRTRDMKTFMSAFNLKGTDAPEKEGVKKLFGSLVEADVTEVQIVPLDAPLITTYRRGNVRYKKNVAPVGYIKIEWKRKGGGSSARQQLFGDKNGAYLISGTIKEKIKKN